MLSAVGRRSVLVGSAAAAAVLVDQRARASEPTIAPLALELFTSQGCSSCPPADMQLGELTRRADIVPLSFHVDYWDYIGWKDRFATHQMTERQRIYARVLKQRYLYTPEMVIDGVAHQTGTDKSSLAERLDEARKRLPIRATPQLTRDADGSLVITLAPYKVPVDGADIVFVVYDRRHATPVHEGENSGRTIENFNVVRRFETLARWNGAAAEWRVPADRLQPDQGLAVLVQLADQGPMLGCNKHEPMASG